MPAVKTQTVRAVAAFLCCVSAIAVPRLIAAQSPGKAAAQSPAKASAAPSALETTLVALEKQSWEAWQKRDGKFFESFLTDDHVEVGTGGPTSKAVVVAGVKSPACVVKTYAIDTFKLTQFTDDMALLTYHAAQDTLCGGKPVPSPVFVSSLYVKRAGRWQNAAYQQTAQAK